MAGVPLLFVSNNITLLCNMKILIVNALKL